MSRKKHPDTVAVVSAPPFDSPTALAKALRATYPLPIALRAFVARHGAQYGVSLTSPRAALEAAVRRAAF